MVEPERPDQPWCLDIEDVHPDETVARLAAGLCGFELLFRADGAVQWSTARDGVNDNRNRVRLG